MCPGTATFVVDGALLPCPGWRDRRDPWSVKHRRAGMNDPDPGPAQRRVHVGLGPLSGVHARRGRTGPLRMDRRQGVRGKRDDHPAQEAPQRRTERNREGGEQERQQDPPGRKSAPSPTSNPGESSTHPTADPWKHSSRPSPQHSHSTSSKPPSE